MSSPVRYCRRCGCYLPDRQQKCLACGARDYPGKIQEAKEPPYTFTGVLYADDKPVEFVTESASDSEAWLRSIYTDSPFTLNDWRATYLGERPIFKAVDSNTKDKD